MPRTRIERLVAEKTAVTPDIASRLAKLFGTTPSFRLNMQAFHDITVAEAAMKDEIERIDRLGLTEGNA